MNEEPRVILLSSQDWEDLQEHLDDETLHGVVQEQHHGIAGAERYVITILINGEKRWVHTVIDSGGQGGLTVGDYRGAKRFGVDGALRAVEWMRNETASVELVELKLTIQI